MAATRANKRIALQSAVPYVCGVKGGGHCAVWWSLKKAFHFFLCPRSQQYPAQCLVPTLQEKGEGLSLAAFAYPVVSQWDIKGHRSGREVHGG